jgi:hypothetical protein
VQKANGKSEERTASQKAKRKSQKAKANNRDNKSGCDSDNACGFAF